MFRFVKVSPFRLSLVAIPLLVLALLAGACGDNGEETTATPARTSPAAATSPARTSPAATKPGGATSPAASPGATTVTIKAVPVLKFNTDELHIPAGRATTVTMDNTDTGIPHDFVIYKDEAAARANQAPLFKTNTCTGPCKESVAVTLQAGEYFFRCDIHPTQMTGTVEVE